jgi:hypothetical protein
MMLQVSNCYIHGTCVAFLQPRQDAVFRKRYEEKGVCFRKERLSSQRATFQKIPFNL